MKHNFIEELRWRGMLHSITPGVEELLNSEGVKGYIGFDPTSDSLGIGNLVQIMILLHFQKAGHKPIALMGGATGMIGDPSGKKEERKLLGPEEIEHNIRGIEKQLQHFLHFGSGENPAEIVNNYDWFQSISTISFLRDVGKYLTVNYLLSKGFVKDRLVQEQELSFTEFNYILMQSYDFLWLYENKNCALQLGGSDQWGNITAGIELIRKKIRGSAFGITCPLITNSDGTKFGKTEEGNVWLDPRKTSPYKFYQFWLNVSDEDAKKYIRIFTLFTREEIEQLEVEHTLVPHLRILQKALAKDITIRVHTELEYDFAMEASELLFGKGTQQILQKLSEEDLKAVFEGVPQVTIPFAELEKGIPIIDFLSVNTNIFPSKGEARKMLTGGGVFINKEKIEDLNFVVGKNNLIKEHYILAQKGKKNYYLIKLT
jgi:tyrosyl-tRNA synthetase